MANRILVRPEAALARGRVRAEPVADERAAVTAVLACITKEIVISCT